jgi:hypothetical protein
MSDLGLCLLIELWLGFGVAGLLWPEKFMPLFEILMFPWSASERIVRANCLAALGGSLALAVRLLVR